jgi:hypothetical protein
MNEPDNIRPPIALYLNVEYLRKCIVDLDRLQPNSKVPYNMPNIPNFFEVYSFVRDRAKSISQDFGIINTPSD